MTCDIIFWDVQHGSATHIKTPNGTRIVHDLGTGSYTTGNRDFSPLVNLKNSGVEKLDCAIITHPHRDHIRDIINLDELSPCILNWPEHITRAYLMKGTGNQHQSLLEKYLELVQEYSEPVAPEQNPRFPHNNGGVSIQVFAPTSCKSDLNNHSLVTIISYGHIKVLLPGDNGIPSWRELLARDDFKDSIKDIDILLAPDHGRDSGFCQELFRYFNPKLTIISEGRHCDQGSINRYLEVSEGWIIHRRSGGVEQRQCLNTRKDGAVLVKLGVNPEGGPFIYVSID